MIDPLTVVAGAGLAGVAGASLYLARETTPTGWATLSFPPDLEADQVETMLATVAGLPARARVTARVDATNGQLSFGLLATPADLASIRSSTQGFAPRVRVDEVPEEPADLPRLRAWIGWRGTHVLLRRDQRELAVGALLGALHSAGRRERVRLSLRLRPVVRPKAPRAGDGDRDLVSRVMAPTPALPRDQLGAIRNQYAGPLLNVKIEVSVWAGSDGRARQLLAQIVAVLRGRSGARGRFSARSHRFALPGFGTVLAPTELVPLLGWPVAGPTVPGVSYIRAPRLLPDPAIPTTGGRCFGVSTWPGLEERRICQPPIGALSHALILGPTGSGKSALLARLLLDDVDAGRGALLLDMKGDTVTDVVERIPEHRHDDVVVLDPSDARPLPSLKAMGGSPDLTADLWVGLFRTVFADSWGLRTERYIRLGVQTLIHDPTASIVDLPRVFVDRAFRRRLLTRADNPLLASSWATFDGLSPAQQSEHLIAPLGKVEDLIGRRVIRRVLGQPEPKMSIAQAMRENRIVVVRMAPGELGSGTAQLLGGLAIYEIYQAVMARQAVAREHRRPFSVYVDEPAVIRLLPVPLDSLYELARGLGVSLTLATQSVAQLPKTVQEAVLTNAATLVSFRADYADARLIARRLLGVTGEEIEYLDQYETVVRLGLDHGRTSSVATVRTLPLPEPTADAEAIRERSAAQYGAPPIEPETQARPEPAETPPDDVPIGRRRTR